MIALYKKELRGLLPLFTLVVVLFGSDFLYRPFTERLDEVSWVDQSGQLDPVESREIVWILMVLALVAAYNAFPREHDEGTIELLYALPIRRPGIFFAKALAAWTVLVTGLLLDQVAGATLQAANPQSFTGEQWRLGLAAQVTFINGFYFAVVLCHGLLISFLRRFGLLVYAMAYVALSLVKKYSPGSAWLDPNELLIFEYHGTELLVPWSDLGFHGAVALAAAGLAYALWMGPAEVATPFFARLRSHVAGRLALGCVPLAMVLGVLAWMTALAAKEIESASQPVRYTSFLPVRAETLWFDFTYDSNLRERAHQLIRRADRIYEEVAAFMGVEPGRRIDADLTDEGGAHLGIAQGGVLRVALETLSAEEALMTLYHETVHAFQYQLGGRRVAEHMGSLRFFVEGSAVYVTEELLSNPDARRAHRFLAVAAYERHDIRFEELVDDQGLKASYDPSLVYVLGETWTSALAETCGDGAVGAFFRALDRDDAPEDLEGISLWQDTLRAVGCALEPAVSRWGERMAGLARTERETLEALPRLGGGVVEVDGGELVVQVRADRDLEPPADTYYLRVRRGPQVPEDEIHTLTAEIEPDGSGAYFRVPRQWLDGASFELQFGQSIAGSLWPFFEEWQAVTL